MDIYKTLKIVAMIFITVTATLLVLSVFNVINGEDMREALVKFAAVCGIIAVTSLALSFLGNNKK